MYLIIGSTPAGNWERVLPLLTEAGCVVPAAIGPSLEQACADLLGTAAASPAVLATNNDTASKQLDFAANDFAQAHLLLFHSRPETALAQAMAEQGNPDQTLEKWQQAAQQLLQVYRHNRQRASLVNIDCALAAPALFMKACHKRFGLKKAKPPHSNEAGSKNTESSDMHLLLAAQMVAQSAPTSELIAELEAGSLPLAEQPEPNINCQQIHQDYQAVTRQANELKEVKEENELLLLQLHQVQEELESYYLQLQSEQEKHRQAKSELAELKKEQKRHKAKVNQLNGRIDRLQKSTSWKITAPMRGLVKLVKPARKATS
ncbi:hypothetical protein [Desulfurivibrio alkaliphilus]|uniref:Uncharacterized protein n=1 Tax=Desulfurivibrio alkaliphilus (strain DSM 19089 / UNIQEM U267 / AHT2) TaxID=589865 RepID=D6Z4R1_DESAT|nr:hypothetical protein [Desulfurivibrio alkaliphilus]ADH86536.1 hypothetical protein DaAHT2_1855 [Desulfurivibrio alkaliphilus AHT 2]